MYNYCVEKWVTGAKLPAEVCSINGGETVMHIGKMKAGAKTEELDVANCDGTGLEFTANAIGYFTNPTTGSIIIDVSGMGVANVCTKKIGIPVIKDSFEKWFSSPKNGYYTMYRAWKLRAKGFDFKDDDTKKFIVDKAVAGFDAKPKDFTALLFLRENWMVRAR